MNYLLQCLTRFFIIIFFTLHQIGKKCLEKTVTEISSCYDMASNFWFKIQSIRENFAKANKMFEKIGEKVFVSLVKLVNKYQEVVLSRIHRASAIYVYYFPKNIYTNTYPRT